jgi:RND family efflux transporter MFP subunit
MKTNLLNALVVFVSMTLLGAACAGKKENNNRSNDAIIVRTQPVATTSYVTALQYSGKLASTSETNLSFKVGGIISRIYVKEGDQVSRGQLLATLDLTEINAQVQQAKQNVDKAQRDLQRVKNLLDDTAATLEQYQNAQTQHSVAGEALRIASFNQQYAQIRATENGTIIKKIMNEGEMASTGSQVLMMNATSGDDWVVRFGVSDRDWALLKKGQEATVQIDAYPNQNFKGVINKIADAADPASGTYEIEIKVLPGDKKFAAGLFCNIQLNTTANEKVTMIPIEALTEGNGKTGYVYLLNNDNKTVTKKRVVIAFVDNDKVGISNGLENVNNVITDGVSYLTEDAVVKPAKSLTPKAE